MVWHPHLKSHKGRIEALTSTVDIFASVLEIAGVARPERSHSQSFVPLLSGDFSSARDAVIYGTFGQGICCTDGEWTLIQPPDRTKPLYAYSTMVPTTIDPKDTAIEHSLYIPGVEMPQWKLPVTLDGPQDRRAMDSEPFLYHRKSDPGQQHDVWNTEIEHRARMELILTEKLKSYGAPPELFGRLGLAAR